MTILYAILIISICFAICAQTYWIWVLRRERRAARLPDKSKPTMFDVRRLLREGEKDAAIRLYCQIFNVASKKARKDIEELERSLKV